MSELGLDPIHRADAHKSGLTDESIQKCEFWSARPQEIKNFKPVESAMCLPYFTPDGKRTGFVRYKFFPPRIVEGKSQKYGQKKDSDCELYLPPIAPWVNVVGEESQTLVWTEGEKKAAAACQAGLFCVGVAGVWNWRQELDTHQRTVLPSFDYFNFKGRIVEIVPDSDLWRAEKLQGLCGFYALAKALVHRGAIPRFVVLPESGQGKVGLDDWLKTQSGDLADAFKYLTRIDIGHGLLAPASKWYQVWEAAEQEAEALRKPDEELTVEQRKYDFLVRFPRVELEFSFSKMTNKARGLEAELMVRLQGRILKQHVWLQMQSSSNHTECARSLSGMVKQLPWKRLIERACAAVVSRTREPETLIYLDPTREVAPISFSLNPLVFKNKPTVLFSDGGVGKSTLALFMCFLVASGGQVAGLSAVPGKALYADWEDDDHVHLLRVKALAAGHPELQLKHPIAYQRFKTRLVTVVEELERRIHQEGITFLVIDSLLYAAGGKADAEQTEAFFTALRQLDVSTLIIAHVAKTQADGPSDKTIYGSVFSSNFARSTWEVRTEQTMDEEHALLGLFNKKSNLARLHAPIGLKVTRSLDGMYVEYQPANLAETEELAKGLPPLMRVRTLMKDGKARSIAQIVDELNISLESVRTVCKRGEKKGWLIGSLVKGEKVYVLNSNF